MVRCRNCGEEISRHDLECPDCGYNPGSAIRRFGAGLVIFGAGIAFVSPPIGLFGIFAGIIAMGGSYLVTPAE
ncbi:hypothetical protein [Natrialbaceae archaeon AArc-T1-2]|uniref:hypothetical protein n=1 Tax=Natrialbaceae archaeon AArc-T1-2 TaxID=3053904 RepID=UPI00255A9D20|nr:hypothetical protein [Natrialbaceae archaeon AArc-T1-2]WIV68539.1 hypothetical protein QQ977_07400 [Natrialbaceae archaeon AArc-T1-2]